MIRVTKVIMMFKQVDAAIFEYPKWRHLIPNDINEEAFNTAWEALFDCPFNECNITYGGMTFGGNRLGNGMTVVTPRKTVLLGGFDGYTDDPILGPEQSFYYGGSGVTWGTDIIGQRFYLIEPKSGLPVNWEEHRNMEVVKKYVPFTLKLFT